MPQKTRRRNTHIIQVDYKKGDPIRDKFIESTNEVYHEQNAKLLKAIADRIKADPKLKHYLKKKNLLPDDSGDICNAWLQYKLKGLAKHKFTHNCEYYGCIFEEFGNNTILVYVPSIRKFIKVTIPW
jgi:hypothetical protein